MEEAEPICKARTVPKGCQDSAVVATGISLDLGEIDHGYL